jgi:hypothetical protein
MRRLSRNSGNLNLLEPSGPLQACNGIVFPFVYSFILYLDIYINHYTYIDNDGGGDDNIIIIIIIIII